MGRQGLYRNMMRCASSATDRRPWTQSGKVTASRETPQGPVPSPVPVAPWLLAAGCASPGCGRPDGAGHHGIHLCTQTPCPVPAPVTSFHRYCRGDHGDRHGFRAVLLRGGWKLPTASLPRPPPGPLAGDAGAFPRPLPACCSGCHGSVLPESPRASSPSTLSPLPSVIPGWPGARAAHTARPIAGMCDAPAGNLSAAVLGPGTRWGALVKLSVPGQSSVPGESSTLTP